MNINMSPTTSSMRRGADSETESIRSQIAKVQSQIIKLSTKIQEIEKSNISEKEKEAQIKPIRTQIDALVAQMNMLMAELARKKEGDKPNLVENLQRAQQPRDKADDKDAFAGYSSTGILPVSNTSSAGTQLDASA